jgi:hypothetical protein
VAASAENKVEFLLLTSGSTVVLGAGNFTGASDTLFKVGVLTGMNCFPLLGDWFVKLQQSAMKQQ